MFSGYKIIYAKNHVIMELVDKGLIPKHQEQLMRDIAGNPMNHQYGKGILQMKIASCKFSAIAAVFARLAVYYEARPTEDLTSCEWKLAAVHAMKLAGADPEEAEIAVDGLMNMNREVKSQDIF